MLRKDIKKAIGNPRNQMGIQVQTSAWLLPNWRRPGWPVPEADLSLSSWILRRSASLCFSSFRIRTASWAVPTYPSPIPDIFLFLSLSRVRSKKGMCDSRRDFSLCSLYIGRGCDMLKRSLWLKFRIRILQSFFNFRFLNYVIL